MSFCPKCGSRLSDGAMFCPGCGKAVGADGAQNQQNQQNQQQTQYQQTYQPSYQTQYQTRFYPPVKNILQQLSEKIKIQAILAIVIACIQYLMGFWFIIAGADAYDGTGLIVYGIFVLLVAALNTVVSVQNFKLSADVLICPVGILSRFSPIGGCVGILIYNIFFGGLVGIAVSIYAFIIRNFVITNEMQFAEIEQKYNMQYAKNAGANAGGN